MKKIVAVFFAFLISSLFCARAETQAPKRLALLVGNWDYNLNSLFDTHSIEPFVSDLKNPCQDIEKIRIPLEQDGFSIYEFCNLDKDQFDRDRDQFIDVSKSLPDGSIIFVYYSGHGVQVNGRLFAIPVLFKLDSSILEGKSAREQSKYFLDNSFLVKNLFDSLPKRKEITLVLVLDSCRDIPVGVGVDYDQYIEIANPPNSIFHTVVTSGDRALDDGSYASMLSAELAKGGEIGEIMNRVGTYFYYQWENENRATYVYANTGIGFVASKYRPMINNKSVDIAFNSVHRAAPKQGPAPAPALAPASGPVIDLESSLDSVSSPDSGTAPVTAKVTGRAPSSIPNSASVPDSRSVPVSSTNSTFNNSHPITPVFTSELDEKLLSVFTSKLTDQGTISIDRKKHSVRNIYDGVSFDILWCEGPGERERYIYALSLAEIVSEEAVKLGFGRVRLVPLSETNNTPSNGYGVFRNILRYDPELADERKILIKMATTFPSANFMPVRGIGVGGKPTNNYVSAFVCGDLPKDI